MNKVLLILGSLLVVQGFSIRAMETLRNRIAITSEDDFNKALRTNDNAVLLVSTTWCGPCRQIKPIVEELTQELPNITFVHIDGDNKELATLVKQYAKQMFPTIVLFKKGQAVGDIAGFRQKDELKAAILSQLGLAPQQGLKALVAAKAPVVVKDAPQAKTVKALPAKKYYPAKYRSASGEEYSYDESYSEEFDEEGDNGGEDHDNDDDDSDDFDDSDDHGGDDSSDDE